MAVPMMQYVEAVPPMQQGLNFSPPVMAEVGRQVYELPPQPSQPLPLSTTGHTIAMQSGQPSMADVELLQVDSNLGQLTGYPRIPSAGGSSGATSPASAFSGPSLETALSGNQRRNRSMSCTSKQSDASLPFRHDPYAAEPNDEQVYVESVSAGARTPSPRPISTSPALSSTGSYSFTGIPPLEGSSSFSYPVPGPPSPLPYSNSDSQPFVPISDMCNSAIQPTVITPVGTSTRSGPTQVASCDVIHPAGMEEADKKKKKKEPKKAVAAMCVKFKHGREGEYYSDQAREVGKHVIIEGQRGQDLGVVTSVRIVDNKPRAERRRRRVRRDATQEEINAWQGELFREEEQALSIMKAQVTKHRVPIVVHRAEYQFDRKKLTFHYTTKVAKPDFRSVLHDGFRHFKCRIWMNNCDPSSCEPGDRLDLNSECLPVHVI